MFDIFNNGVRNKSENKEGIPNSSPLFSSSNKFVGFHPSRFQVLYKDIKLSLSELQKIKDKKSEIFLNNSYIFDNKDGSKIASLKEISEKKQIQQRAETQNLINSVMELSSHRELTMVFVTLTLHPSFHSPKDIRDIKKGHLEIRRYYNEVRKDKLFREPTKKLMEKLQIPTPWVWINPKTDYLYIRMKEFHKDWTLHDHTVFFIPRYAIQAFISLLYRKKSLMRSIGRIEIVLSDSLKKEVLNASEV